MLEQADGWTVADAVRHRAEVGPVVTPDRDVLEDARTRLCAASPAPPDPHSLADLRAIDAVIQGARPGAGSPAAPGLLEVGAALALLANARRHLDRVEADLLDTARQLNLSWDLIGAIVGLPAAVVEERAQVLRGRPGPQ